MSAWWVLPMFVVLASAAGVYVKVSVGPGRRADNAARTAALTVWAASVVAVAFWLFG